MNVVLPELDGRLLTRAISFKAEAPVDPRLEFASVRHAPDLDRIDYVARLAVAWAGLGTTPRNERRLALVLSDYPARGGRTGYAVGLDTAASAAGILQLLDAEGYDTGARDWQAADIERLLHGKADWIEIAMPAHRAWLKALPPSLQAHACRDVGRTRGRCLPSARAPLRQGPGAASARSRRPR